LEHLEIDYYRLRDKGLTNIILSIFSAGLLLYALDIFSHAVWPLIFNYLEANQIGHWKFALFGAWATNIVVFIFVNLAYAIPYKLNHPFFEQHKIMKDEDWPWI